MAKKKKENTEIIPAAEISVGMTVLLFPEQEIQGTGLNIEVPIKATVDKVVDQENKVLALSFNHTSHGHFQFSKVKLKGTQIPGHQYWDYIK